MKNYKFFFFTVVWCFYAFGVMAQGNLKLILTVKDEQLKALPNANVSLVETETRRTIHTKTNNAGIAEVLLEGGTYWQINVHKVIDYWAWQITMPKVPKGKTAELSRTITYSYERYLRESRPAVDRTQLSIMKEKQNFSPAEKPTKELGILKLYIRKADGSPLPNYPVALTCYKLLKTFETNTNASGLAIFKVPNNSEYQIDIDGIDNYDYVDLPNYANLQSSKTMTYEPTTVPQTEVNDTIRQQIPESMTAGTSKYGFITLHVVGGRDGVWKNERIYLETIKGKKVYAAQTNELGQVKFLLPKGQKYMIHLTYQRDIDVVDFTRTRGIGYSRKNVRYAPDPRLQYPNEYIPSLDRLYLTDFQEFYTKQFPMPKASETLLTYAKFATKINAESKQAVLTLGFQGEEISSTQEISSNVPPINLSVVIDKSGSMAGYDRIERLREALLLFVDKLRPTDILSLVTFNDTSYLNIPAQKIGENKEEIKTLIGLVEADGGTNIYHGLVRGYEETLKNYKKGSTNRLILLSDGYGSDPVTTTVEKSKEYNAKGIECSAVGVGADYNVSLLKLLASNGGGLVELVEDSEKLHQTFIKQITSVLFPIATDVKIEVLYNKNLLFAQLHGFPVEEKREGKLKFKTKNVYSGLKQLALLKFTLINPTQALEKEPIIIKTTFFDLRQKKEITQETKVYLEWSPANGLLEYQMEAEEKKTYGIALMNQALKAMAEAFGKGDRTTAQKVLTETLSEIQKIFPDATDEDIKTLIKQMTEYSFVLSNLK